MTLVTTNKRNWFPSIFDELLAPNFFEGITANAGLGLNVPAVNILEKENSFFVELAVPGKKKEDFNIALEDQVLTISSETKHENEEKDEKGKYTRKEFSYSSFKRSFTLPDMVDEEKINAKYEEGVLKIEIPKKEVAIENSKRMIEIS